MTRFEMIRGFPFPHLPYFKAENIEKSLDYVPLNGDTIIASYPKTGTNWLQYIVLQITSKGKSFPSFADCIYKKVPFMEVTGTEAIEKLKGLRIYKNHYRYDMVQKNPKSKVLYIYRKPEDTLVSWYHYMESLRGQQLDLDDFFEDFLTGDIEYGSYFDHVLSYLDHENDGNLLLVSYEKLHSNGRGEILRIAKFLGDQYFESLSGDESLLEKILERTSFEYMKINLVLAMPERTTGSSKRVLNYFRKGTVGDGKESLSANQLKRLHVKMEEKMKGTKVLQEWLD